MTPRIRLACALVAFPAGWAVRQAGGPAAGGVVVLALIGLCALGLPARRAALVVVTGIASFVAVHLVAAVTATAVGLIAGGALFASLGSALWRDESSSSGQRATPAI